MYQTAGWKETIGASIAPGATARRARYRNQPAAIYSDRLIFILTS